MSVVTIPVFFIGGNKWSSIISDKIDMDYAFEGKAVGSGYILNGEQSRKIKCKQENSFTSTQVINIVTTKRCESVTFVVDKGENVVLLSELQNLWD